MANHCPTCMTLEAQLDHAKRVLDNRLSESRQILNAPGLAIEDQIAGGQSMIGVVEAARQEVNSAQRRLLQHQANHA